MPYPVRYRPGSLPSNRRRSPAPLSPEPWMFGPPLLAGAGAALWASQQLMEALNGGGGWIGSRPYPGNFGWTLFRDCGRPNQREIVAFGPTCGAQTVLFQNYNLAPAANRTQINYWQIDSMIPNYALQRYSNVLPAQTWTRGAAGPVPAALYAPTYQYPKWLLGGPIPWPIRRALGWQDRGYAPHPPLPYPTPYPIGGRFDVVWRDVYDPDAPPVPGNPPANPPVVIPRAVPYPNTREVKLGMNTSVGRAFMALNMAYNFMGDVWGFTRAMWRSLPREWRGRSRRLDRMLNDLWRYWKSPRTRSDEELANVLGRMVVFGGWWKAQDTVVGGISGDIFKAQSEAYGYAAARAWSMLDSEIRAAQSSIERSANRREERSTRG